MGPPCLRVAEGAVVWWWGGWMGWRVGGETNGALSVLICLPHEGLLGEGPQRPRHPECWAVCV